MLIVREMMQSEDTFFLRPNANISVTNILDIEGCCSLQSSLNGRHPHIKLADNERRCLSADLLRRLRDMANIDTRRPLPTHCGRFAQRGRDGAPSGSLNRPAWSPGIADGVPRDDAPS